MRELRAEGYFPSFDLVGEEPPESHKDLPRFGKSDPTGDFIDGIEDVGSSRFLIQVSTPFAACPAVLVQGNAKRGNLSVIGSLAFRKDGFHTLNLQMTIVQPLEKHAESRVIIAFGRSPIILR